MITLMMISFGDSAGSIYMPMYKHNPGLLIYFLVFIFVISICLMNLITAVIVERSLDQAENDKEVEKIHKAHVVEKMMPQLREMFKELDQSGDGFITLEEFGKCDQKIQEKL